MSWLQPAIALMLVSSLILGGTFLYLWAAMVRRRYVLLWALAWFAAVPYLVLTWIFVSHAPSYFPWTLHQILLILNAILMVGGCYEFVHRRLPLVALASWSTPFLFWAIVAPVLTDRFLETTLPNSLLLGGSYLWTASRFAIYHREHRIRGARLVAILFAAAGIHEFDYPLFGNHPWAAPLGYFLASILAISISLCLLVMILEEARSETQRERRRLKGILDNLPVGVLVTNPQGEVSLANAMARQWSGIDPDRPAGGATPFPAKVFRKPDDTPCDPAELPIAQSLRTGGASPPQRFQLITPDGTTRDVLASAGPVVDEDGTFLGAVAVIQDIGDLNRNQEQEISNPTAQVPSMSATGSARGSETVGDAVVFDLAEIVREAMGIIGARWRDDARGHGIRYGVRMELADDLKLTGHPSDLKEALLDLVQGFPPALSDDGTLLLSLAREREEAVLRMSFTSLGAAPSLAERGPELPAKTHGVNGAGPHLVMDFECFHRHAARISLVSESPRDTTLTLTFPLLASAGRADLSALRRRAS